MSTVVKDLGAVSAYAYAVEKGYTGTEAEFAELMADYAEVGQRAEDAADSALESKTAAKTAATTATNKASEATTAATTATTKAAEASTSASTATSAKDTAVSASQAATTKASEATTAAATAVSAKDDAVSANTAAQSAKTAAQTAQTGAETAAASVEASAEQIATNASDISQLKSEFTALESDGVVPSAEQILSDKGVTDSVPYHYRKTGGDGADRLYDKIVGGTVCFNQFVHNITPTTIGDVEMTVNNDGSVTINGTATVKSNLSIIIASTGDGTLAPNHVYFIKTCPKATGAGTDFYGGIAGLHVDNDGNGGLYKHTNSFTLSNVRIDFNAGAVFNNAKVYPQYTDLTQALGPAIADHIYQLEQTTAGAGVALFKSLFPNDYYPYNAGELLSVSGLSEHRTVGFNQFDLKKFAELYPDDCSMIGDELSVIAAEALYNTGCEVNIPFDLSGGGYITVDVKCGTASNVRIRIIYADGTYEETSGTINTSYQTQSRTLSAKRVVAVRFNWSRIGSFFLKNFCINLSDPTKNGTYEPYKAHSYPLDSTLTLRGLFKLDANNKLYADGDTYDADGTVTRNTILRAYQSGDESLANAITDGTNTVVYSANASTEQADPYQHLQQCDPNGTEEYVSTGIVPIGHNSFYPENLRAKVEGLPWNFASLIAPTESAFTATRNYTTGSLFIVDNVLYKATSNIANGGTITPNTNCTATTLAEIISALA